MKQFWFYAPRILSLLFVAFLSLFALDAFQSPFEWQMIIGFLIHLIPSMVLLIALVIAWKYELVGVVIFIVFAVLYVLGAGFDRPWQWYAFIAGPAFIVGVLYLVSWLLKRKEESKQVEGVDK